MEFINFKGVPFIRYEGTLINVNNVRTFDLHKDMIFVTFADGEQMDLDFPSHEEASLAFDKIMGGKDASPTSRELKENKTRHTAIEQEQAEWL